MEKHPAEMYKDHLRPFLYSKLEEFKILGYDDVEHESLWSYLIHKKWKQKKEMPLYELAGDILSVKIGDFMNYATVEAFKSSNWLESDEGQEALDELLR
ncbi:post-transcriptional regulator [Bacillus siamensis]|uniref:Competence protein ComN n=1 Tax=Bacillus siamensis TaxID=659243 RepID=A0AAI8HM89_9BACI|nr:MULTISPECIES: post-transcriptional regulator [Bacillus]AME07975.1 competence protein ComN [Bacillus sp. SDLI1]AUJ76584.1 competence protein ComN [Bacillus siamensis]MBD0408070.1 post-transcriptional regulator [Bacillus sp. 1021]MDU0811321.1 post-transcriptional regulator [Bacillus siamensis]MED5048754.1 post-transcriptional regulator [Bacillus siamensis]